jgi:predicted DNA-binding protein with PD1-like motif
MHARVLSENGERSVVVVFDTGEEVVHGLTAWATQHRVTGARFTAIGAFSDAVLGYFDWERKDYQKISIHEQVEVLSLVGNIALKGSEPSLHAHVVLGKADGSAHGGHLLEAHVRPTLEVVIEEAPRELRRVFDSITGLALLDAGKRSREREK